MVHRRPELLEDLYRPTGVEGGAEGDLPEELWTHVMRAAEAENPRAGRSAAQHPDQQVLVRAGGARDGSPEGRLPDALVGELRAVKPALLASCWHFASAPGSPPRSPL